MDKGFSYIQYSIYLHKYLHIHIITWYEENENGFYKEAVLYYIVKEYNQNEIISHCL